MKIYPILWKHNQLKDGTYPLKIRVFFVDNGKKKEKYHPLNIYIKPNQWDESTFRVKNHPNASDYNSKILTTLKNLETQKVKDEPISLTKALIGNSFIKYFEYYNESIVKIKHSAHHYSKLNNILAKLKTFAPGLKFEEIDRDFLRRYEVNLINIGNNSTTIHDNFKRIKFIYDEAISERIINPDINPFDEYKVKLIKTKKARLTYSKILEIENLELKPGTSIWHTRNHWLFSFYCAGIRFSDICRITKKNIKNDRLIYTMHKSLKNSSPQHRNIKLMPQALEILNHYLPLRNKYVFGIIEELPEDKFKEKELISSKNSLANKNLKLLAEKIGVEKSEISFHTSRHSFSDYCKKKKLDIHIIKDLLGHSRVGTTEIYMRDFYEEETDEAMETLFSNKK